MRTILVKDDPYGFWSCDDCPKGMEREAKNGFKHWHTANKKPLPSWVEGLPINLRLLSPDFPEYVTWTFHQYRKEINSP